MILIEDQSGTGNAAARANPMRKESLSIATRLWLMLTCPLVDRVFALASQYCRTFLPLNCARSCVRGASAVRHTTCKIKGVLAYSSKIGISNSGAAPRLSIVNRMGGSTGTSTIRNPSCSIGVRPGPPPHATSASTQSSSQFFMPSVSPQTPACRLRVLPALKSGNGNDRARRIPFGLLLFSSCPPEDLSIPCDRDDWSEILFQVPA